MAGERASGRLAGVEGLRALAACSIVVYHVWLYGDPAGVLDFGRVNQAFFVHLPAGVTLFFALSGFLLFRPWAAAALHGADSPRISLYLRSRALRIFPAYWVILFVTAVVLPAAVLPGEGETIGRLAPDALAANALLVQNYVPSFIDTGILPAWTLVIELGFYIVLPALGTLGMVLSRRWRGPRGRIAAALAPVLAISVIGFTQRSLFAMLPDGSLADVVRRSFAYSAGFFALGMALAVVAVLVDDGAVRLPSWWRRAAWAALAVVVAGGVEFGDRTWVQADPLVPYHRLTATACALLLALVVLPGREPRRTASLVRVLESRVLVGIGVASYSLFLWHEPLIRLLREWGMTMGGEAGLVLNLAVIAAVAGALSALTYRLVERPALARKRPYRHPQVAAPAGALGVSPAVDQP